MCNKNIKAFYIVQIHVLIFDKTVYNYFIDINKINIVLRRYNNYIHGISK